MVIIVVSYPVALSTQPCTPRPARRTTRLASTQARGSCATST